MTVWYLQYRHAVTVHLTGHNDIELELLDRSQVQEIVRFILRTVLTSGTETGATSIRSACHDVLLRLLKIQPKDTFTQAVLQQMAAVATLQWMSGEIKTKDLR